MYKRPAILHALLSSLTLGRVEERKNEHKECKYEEEYGTRPGKNRVGNEGVDEKPGCKGDKDNIKKQREGDSVSHSSDSGVVDLEDVYHCVYPESNSQEAAVCLGKEGEHLLNNKKQRHDRKEKKLEEIEHANKASCGHNLGQYECYHTRSEHQCENRTEHAVCKTEHGENQNSYSERNDRKEYAKNKASITFFHVMYHPFKLF